jgi:hypothetical protein
VNDGVSTLDVVTLVVAIIGALTGVASLVWAMVAHLTTGVRAAVELSCGWVTPDSFLSFDPATVKQRPFGEGVTGRPVFGVTVRNRGRLPLVVTSLGVGTTAVSLLRFEDPYSPPLPHELGVSAEATWFAPAHDLVTLLAASQHAKLPTTELQASARLGTGKSIKSRKVDARRAVELLAGGL